MWVELGGMAHLCVIWIKIENGGHKGTPGQAASNPICAQKHKQKWHAQAAMAAMVADDVIRAFWA